jgi:hypothetical protein
MGRRDEYIYMPSKEQEAEREAKFRQSEALRLQREQEAEARLQREREDVDRLREDFLARGLLHDGISQVSDTDLERTRDKTALILDQSNAELLRRGLEENTEWASRIAVAPTEVPPASAVVKQSGRQMRQTQKMRDRQQANQRKAMKEYKGKPEDAIALSTCYTIPMMKEIKKLNRKEENAEPIELKDPMVPIMSDFFQADMFERTFNAKSDVSLNIEGIRTKIATATAAINQVNRKQIDPEEYPVAAAAFVHFQKTIDAARLALRVIIGINGVDSATGERLDLKTRTECWSKRVDAVKDYRDLVLNREQSLAEGHLAELRKTYAYASHKVLSTKESDSAIELQCGQSEEDRKYYHLMKKAGIDFSEPEAAQGYMDILKALDTNRAKYESSKDTVDKIFNEVAALQKYIQSRKRDFAVLRKFAPADGLKLDSTARLQISPNSAVSQLFSPETYERMMKLESDAKFQAAQLRAKQLQGAMMLLLNGTMNVAGIAQTEVTMLLEREFDIVTDQRREEKEQLDRLSSAD